MRGLDPLHALGFDEWRTIGSDLLGLRFDGKTIIGALAGGFAGIKYAF